jgi:hypothetical protein
MLGGTGDFLTSKGLTAIKPRAYHFQGSLFKEGNQLCDAL